MSRRPGPERESLATALAEAEKGLRLAQERRDWAGVARLKAQLAALERAAQALLTADFVGAARVLN